MFLAKQPSRGQVLYNQGIMVDASGTIYENYMQAVASQEVYVDVDLSSYKNGSAGTKRYSAITDENGNYSITIPVGQTTISDNIEVKAFVGYYGEIVNGVTFSYDDAIYQASNATEFSVSAGDEKVVNVNLTEKPEFATEGTNRSVSVSGSIETYKEVVVYDSNNNFSDIGSTPADLDNSYVMVKVSHATDERSIYYTLTVNDGGYADDIYFYDTWSFGDVTVSLVRPKEVIEESAADSKKFTHYYVVKGEESVSKQYLAGSYNSLDQSIQLVDSYMDELSYEFTLEYLKFTPADLSTVKGITYGSSDYEYYNPMNW